MNPNIQFKYARREFLDLGDWIDVGDDCLVLENERWTNASPEENTPEEVDMDKKAFILYPVSMLALFSEIVTNRMREEASRRQGQRRGGEAGGGSESHRGRHGGPTTLAPLDGGAETERLPAVLRGISHQ